MSTPGAGRTSGVAADSSAKTSRAERPAPKPFDPRPLVLFLTVLAISIVIYVVWPRPIRLDRLALETPRAEAAKPAQAAPAPETAPVDTGTDPVVEIKTTLGTIKARLFADKAPKTVENFVDLVKKKFYDGVVFHRVIKNFMIQTGDPKGNGTGGREDRGLEPKVLADEFHPALKHARAGLLSMANSGPNTGDTQFFITTAPAGHLDNKHAIFGEVIEGMDVVRKIENVETDSGDKPFDPPRMLEVRLLEAAPSSDVETKEKTP